MTTVNTETTDTTILTLDDDASMRIVIPTDVPDPETQTQRESVPIRTLPISTSEADLELIAVQRGINTVKVRWESLKENFIHLSDAPGGQADPGVVNQLGVTANGVYTYLMDPLGVNSGWGKSPRYLDHWDDLESEDAPIRFLLLNKEMDLSKEEKATALKNIGITIGSTTTRGLLSPDALYYNVVDGVFSPKVATNTTYGVVRLCINDLDDQPDAGSTVTTRSYVDSKMAAFEGSLVTKINNASWGVRGLVALETVQSGVQSINIDENTGIISVHIGSETKAINEDGDSSPGLLKLASVRANNVDFTKQAAWAAPVGLVNDIVRKAIPDAVATTTRAGIVAPSGAIILDHSSSVIGAITVRDAVPVTDTVTTPLPPQGAVRLQDYLPLIDNEDTRDNWDSKDDLIHPVAATPAAVRKYVYDYITVKMNQGMIPTASTTTAGTIKASDSIRVLEDGTAYVPTALDITPGIVKLKKVGNEDAIAVTEEYAKKLVNGSVSSASTNKYIDGDRVSTTTCVAVKDAFSNIIADSMTYGAVRLSKSTNFGDAETRLPIGLAEDGKIYAEYTMVAPDIDIADASYTQSGVVTLSTPLIIDPAGGTSSNTILPIGMSEDGRIYAVMDAFEVNFATASISQAGVVRPTSSAPVSDSTAAPTAVTATGDLYVPPAQAGRYGTVKVSEVTSGISIGYYNNKGDVYTSEKLLRDVLNSYFLATVSQPGLVRVSFDKSTSTCQVGYDTNNRLVADMTTMKTATVNERGPVKLGTNTVMEGSTVPVGLDSNDRMRVSVRDIYTSLSLTYLNNMAAQSATGTYAIGDTIIESVESTVMGHLAKAGYPYSVTIGSNSSTQANNSVAIGYNAVVTRPSGIAIGNGTKVGGDTTKDNSIAIGTSAIADGLKSIAIGYKAVASGAGSVAIGRDAVIANDYVTLFRAGDTNVYLIGGSSSDTSYPAIAYTRGSATSKTKLGKLISLQTLMDTLQGLGADVYNIKDVDGTLTILNN